MYTQTSCLTILIVTLAYLHAAALTFDINVSSSRIPLMSNNTPKLLFSASHIPTDLWRQLILLLSRLPILRSNYLIEFRFPIPRTNRFSYETTELIADTIRIPGFTPKLAIICGTGLGLLSDRIEVIKRVPFEDIPHFSKPSIAGHAGEMIFGNLGGIAVICMRGRFHYYEGYRVQKVIESFPFINRPARQY